jgi:hypothetical protein
LAAYDTSTQRVNPSRRFPLHGDQSELRIQASEIDWVAGDDSITRRLRAYNDVAIDNVGRTRLREQRSNGLGMRSVQRDHLRFIELDHTPKAHLFGWVPDNLSESRGGNYDAVPVLQGRIEN